MSNSLSQAQPTLVIDCRSNRIRIHRKTLHMLGDPEYVQILINPTTRCIAFRSSTDKRAERIHWDAIGFFRSAFPHSTTIQQIPHPADTEGFI